MTAVIPKVTTTISLPFNISSTGRVGAVPDNDPKNYRSMILSLFSVETNERIWYHNFGANLSSILFEPTSSALLEAQAAIEEAFISWVPKLTLVDVQSSYDDISGNLTILVTYKTPTGELDSVSINTESLTPAGEVIKVI